MKKTVLLLLFVYCNVFCMNDLRVRFVEATSPLMFDRVRNFEMSLYQALVNTEAMSGSKHVLENVLRFFADNKTAIENDGYLYKSVCEYIMRSGASFRDNEKKQGKLRSLIVNMLSVLAKHNDAPDVFEKFYKLFSGQYSWITSKDSKFAAYAMLAYASQAQSLSMCDISTLDGLANSNESLSGDLIDVIHNVTKEAPFLVGAYYDVRPENDTLILKPEQKGRIVSFLQEVLENEEEAEGAQIAFTKIVKDLTVRK